MVSNSGKRYVLTIKLYKIPNNAALLVPEKRNPKGRASMDL